MNEIMEKPLATLGFKHISTTRFAAIYTNEQESTLACIILREYVPIRHFKELFSELTQLIKPGNFSKFLFDKSALRTFHQPSMEWYFLEWKTEVLKYGIVKHRKILPEEAWFVKAVEIAKAPLWEKLPEEVKQKLDIAYCHSYKEAMEN